MRNYYAYIRVSTIKQGEKGSSLGEQKDAIDRYAQKHDINISKWFEEQETAAKRGRTIFRRMLTELKRGRAHGLIMHKVDRGARNLADWAELAALMDVGIDVHFAHEAIDLQTRGGRLSADIQAVVASDYIRNLREEVKKGQQGRLKNGLYPFGVVTGYLSNGGGKAKTIDPIQGPLVREAFQLYATGRYTLRTLSEYMKERGLRNSAGRPLGITALAKLLSTPFYCGLIRVKGQLYPGVHHPIIDQTLYTRVRERAGERVYPRTRKQHGRDYAFRRLLRCQNCNNSLYAEHPKGHIYYRCHSQECKGTSLSEAFIKAEIGVPLDRIHEGPLLMQSLNDHFQIAFAKQNSERREKLQAIELMLSKHATTMRRLTDLFVEGALDRGEYENRKNELHHERQKLSEQAQNLSDDHFTRAMQQKFLELLERLRNMDETGNPTKIRETVGIAISNLSVCQKTLDIQWSNAVSMLVDLGGSLAVRRIGTALANEGDTSLADNMTDEQWLKREFERIGDDLHFAIMTDEKLKHWIPYDDDEILLLAA